MNAAFFDGWEHIRRKDREKKNIQNPENMYTFSQ